MEMDATKAIAAMAKKKGTKEKQIRTDMMVAIHQAYLAKEPSFMLFFGNREPSPEEFISVIANDLSSKMIQ